PVPYREGVDQLERALVPQVDHAQVLVPDPEAVPGGLQATELVSRPGVGQLGDRGAVPRVDHLQRPARPDDLDQVTVHSGQIGAYLRAGDLVLDLAGVRVER